MSKSCHLLCGAEHAALLSPAGFEELRGSEGAAEDNAQAKDKDDTLAEDGGLKKVEYSVFSRCNLL